MHYKNITKNDLLLKLTHELWKLQVKLLAKLNLLRYVRLVEFMYLVFARMLGESYCRQLSFFLFLCDIFPWPVNSLVC